VDSSNIALDIGDQSVAPGQDLGRFLPRTGHQPFMLETGGSIQEAVSLASRQS
jgi:hypothetical protein